MKQSAPPADNLSAGNSPEVRYSDGGRGGTIHYDSFEASFALWYELAMLPAVVDIGISESRYWEARTRTPLSQRNSILQFISEQVIHDKLAGKGYALSNAMVMTVYSGKKPDNV